MPKMKSHGGTKKRFKLTGTGKIKRSSAFTGHLARHKSPDQKRHLRKSGLVEGADARRARKLIPYE